MKKALVVDGRPESRHLLSAVLQGHGWEVVEARHGAEALALARQAPPDIAITDLLMPVMDGYTLVRQWKADPELNAVPLVVYTATCTDPQDEKLALALGANAFILKPTEPDGLLKRLRDACGQAQHGELSTEPPPPAEPVVLQPYSEALVRKLEDRLLEVLRLNRHLRDGETRLRTILDTEPECVKLLDAEGRFLDVNAAGLRMLGWDTQDMLGLHAHTLVHHHHADGRPYSVEDCPIYQTLGDGRMRHVGDEVLFRRDGSSFPVEYTCNAVRDANGLINGVVVSFRDISERQRAAARVEHLSRLFATLSQVNQTIVRVKTREELFPAICRAATEHGRFVRTWIGLWDHTVGTLTIAAASGEGDEQLVGTTIDTRGAAFQGGFLARALTTGRLTITRDLKGETASPLERDMAERHGICGAAVAPLHQAGEVAGLVAIGSDEPDFFAPADLQGLVTEMATDISFALDAMAADVQRQRAEAETRMLRTIALGAGSAKDLNDALAFVLQQVCETTGWAMGEAWLPNREGTRLECHPVWHGSALGLEEFRRVSQGFHFAPGEGQPGRVWKTKQPEWIPDLASARFPRAGVAGQAGLKAGLGVPVLAHGEVVLVLEFFLFQPGPEDARRMELVAAVAAQIGSLIERQQATEQLRQRNRELERFHRATTGRELRMVELKKEVNELRHQAGLPPRYRVDFAEPGGEDKP